MATENLMHLGSLVTGRVPSLNTGACLGVYSRTITMCPMNTIITFTILVWGAICVKRKLNPYFAIYITDI